MRKLLFISLVFVRKLIFQRLLLPFFLFLNILCRDKFFTIGADLICFQRTVSRLVVFGRRRVNLRRRSRRRSRLCFT
ncbi:MAG: hypothetical protein AMS17_13410 [Spirochaetes bacterium DG_61]|nr:MAG: hypothetical protein AMS17_13410 [Spirochaetes bacterium DG_61]